MCLKCKMTQKSEKQLLKYYLKKDSRQLLDIPCESIVNVSLLLKRVFIKQKCALTYSIYSRSVSRH